MRPSWQLLAIAGLITLLSIAIIAFPVVSPESLLLIWALLVLCMIVDIALTPGSRRFKLGPAGRHEVFVGENAALMLRLFRTQKGKALPKNSVARILWPEGLTGPNEVALSRNLDVASANIALHAARRGTWVVDRVFVRRPGRLRLIDRIGSYQWDAMISVIPNVRSIVSGEIDLQIVAQSFGAKASSLRGEGSEFHQLSDFVTGMDSRKIDYKRSARHGSLVAREMRAEQNQHVILALDNGHLMREDIEGLPKLDHMIKSALALAWAAVQGGDLVGLYGFDARPNLFIPPSGGRAAFSRIRSHTASLAYRSVETNHTLAISHLHHRLGRRALVVIFSDFVDTTTAELLVENAAVLIRHHVLVFVSVRDPLLQIYTRGAARNLTGVAEAVSVEGLLRERRMVLQKLSRLGVFVIDADPSGITPKLISTYLMIKAKDLI
ncbi:DUF58 domain-containing protein [Oryzifoliimicrobium ureilyticus]|uniref:DUF58 domain-containing protein n=1 Tax=Oryzifoliimicrobium ureilyticus TaxID=3113724 RepID=UPI0030760CE8